MASRELETWTIDRGTSPWRDFTRTYEEEQAGREVRAVPFGDPRAVTAGLEVPPDLVLPGRAAPLIAPLIAIDRAARRVVVNADAFGDLARIDATSLRSGETRAIGVVRDAAFLADPRGLVRFLVTAQIVQTYVHVEASVRLLSEHDDGTRYRAALAGVHTYYTNARHDVPYGFVLGLDRREVGLPGCIGDLFIQGAASERA